MNTGEWFKSSYSNGTGGSNCVEVQLSDSGIIKVRNSKNPLVATAEFSQGEWQAFIDGVKSGQFDL